MQTIPQRPWENGVCICEKPIEPTAQGLFMPYVPACGHILGEPWHLGCLLESVS